MQAAKIGDVEMAVGFNFRKTVKIKQPAFNGLVAGEKIIKD
jgi:hypothetical protein